MARSAKRRYIGLKPKRTTMAIGQKAREIRRRQMNRRRLGLAEAPQ